MSFNPDSKKPAQEVLFSRENSNITHPIIYFNNDQVQRANQQKHLGDILDGKLIFKCHIDKVLSNYQRYCHYKKTSKLFYCVSYSFSFIKQLLDLT